MRILFTGAAWWCNSGYSKPLRYLLPRLGALGHELGLCAFYGWQGDVRTMDCNGTPVEVIGVWKDRFFNDTIDLHYEGFGADCLISLQDVWALSDWGKRGMTWLPWMPVDCWPIPQPDVRALSGCYAPISYSQWGQDKLKKAGFADARYIPFGVDLDVHQPQDKHAARERAGLPRDGFVAGMVGGNSSYPSRKSFPEVLQAWKRYQMGGGEGVLYIHTTISPRRGDGGIKFDRVLDTLGLEWTTTDDQNAERKAAASVLFPSQHRYICSGYNDTDLANLYNAFDVLLEPSMAEGFGIPILEAQACGTPVATLNVTSMPELTWGGYQIEPRQLYWHDRGGWRGVAGVEEIVKVLWHASAGKSAESMEQARAGAMAYGWDRVVAKYWAPLLDEVQANA